MNEMELDLLAGLMPRRQILLKRPDLTKVLTLAVEMSDDPGDVAFVVLNGSAVRQVFVSETPDPE